MKTICNKSTEQKLWIVCVRWTFEGIIENHVQMCRKSPPVSAFNPIQAEKADRVCMYLYTVYYIYIQYKMGVVKYTDFSSRPYKTKYNNIYNNNNTPFFLSLSFDLHNKI